MAESILRSDADKILRAAFKQKCVVHDTLSSDIKTILIGTHKTYKYILLTGLLAKATNNRINPLSLQANAPINGAYDARSLCHNVIVPFERDFLRNALGGSNEPFLNKPARFTHLASTNAVRRGSDTVTLNLLINIFNSLTSSSLAAGYLTCALEFLNLKVQEDKLLTDATLKYNPSLIEIYRFVFRFLEKSFEGETCAILVGTLEKLYHKNQTLNFEVRVHKVNQSGASSKEIGDIDILIEGTFRYAIEVKDKDFNEYDLQHAFDKIKGHNGTKGQFIYGRNAKYDKLKVERKMLEFENQGFLVFLLNIQTYAKMMLFKLDLTDKQDFVQALIDTAIEINSKEDTLRWIQFVLKESNWK